MPQLHIHLLGGFHLVYADAPVSHVNAPRLQSLLAYLVLHRDSPQPRYHLAFLLWPDTTEAQARTNLRQLVHGLRQTLPAADQFVQADAQTLMWRGDAPFRLDVAEFEQAIARADAAERTGNPHALQAALEQAGTIYQGDLLPGCYDDWILPERERLRQVFTETLEHLLLLLESQGEPRAAIVSAQRLLRHDPLREETYRALMRLYAACNDRAGALRIYNTCAAVLARELAIEPSAATREAYAQLLQADAQTRPVMPPPPANTNLPVQLTSFIGREIEMTQIRHLLQTARLLTLTGPGGCGKTRLALEAATNLLDEYPDGVWWVELAGLSDPALVPQAVATELGVLEQSGRTLLETLRDFLRARQCLLLLDNCEHLVEACARLAEHVLSACPYLHILATSREALNIGGETSWLVPSLSLPEAQPPSSAEELMCYESIRLFVERATTALPTFRLTAANAPLVAQICRHLDGIPLAIELGAARVKVLHVEQLAARLDDVFHLLTGGSRTALLRHQTLRAALDWSYDLLSEQEQALFRRLAVFVGGFTLEAAEMVCSGEGIAADEVLNLLSHLVDKSLVAIMGSGGQARYRILETMRQYSREKLLGSAELEHMQNRHLDFFLKLAEAAAPKLTGSEQVAWLTRLENEHDNLSAALNRALERGESEIGLRLGCALCWFWGVHGYLSEGRRWLEQIIALNRRVMVIPGEMSREQRTLLGAALYWAGALALRQGDYAAARARAEESLTHLRAAGDRPGMAFALLVLGNAALDQSDHLLARTLLEESLALYRGVGDKKYIGLSLNSLGRVALNQGDYAAAQVLFEESLTLAREAGDKRDIAVALINLGHVVWNQGDYPEAQALFTESLGLLHEMRFGHGSATCFVEWAGLDRARGQLERAARLSGAAEALLEFDGSRLEREERVEHERTVAIARAQLGEAAFSRLRDEGHAMSLDQAVMYALSESGAAE